MTQTIQGYPYAGELDQRFSPIYQKKIRQLTCIIPGGGCVYYRAHKGDVCPFCAFPIFARHVVKGAGHENDFSAWTLGADIYWQMYLSVVNNTNFDKLAIFNGGSFFPDAELPKEFQYPVYEDVNSKPNIKQLMVEAYPSFIKERGLEKAQEMLTNTDFMVGIGFESHSDFVRNKLLKKRIDRSLFESKVKLLQKHNIQVFVYAFLKAPQLDEREALAETLRTIEYLHNLGVDEIALSSAFVPPDTFLQKQFESGDFRPPWLWTILEIIEQAQIKKWPLSVGGFEDNPAPVAGPSNCNECDSDVNNIIDIYRSTGTFNRSKVLSCHCELEWEQQV